MLKARGTPLVLGLRDVMDEPRQLAEEWERKNAVPALIRSLRRSLGLRPAASLQRTRRYFAAGDSAGESTIHRLSAT